MVFYVSILSRFGYKIIRQSLISMRAIDRDFSMPLHVVTIAQRYWNRMCRVEFYKIGSGHGFAMHAKFSWNRNISIGNEYTHSPQRAQMRKCMRFDYVDIERTSVRHFFVFVVFVSQGCVNPISRIFITTSRNSHEIIKSCKFLRRQINHRIECEMFWFCEFVNGI